jgi:hypothetical protein
MGEREGAAGGVDGLIHVDMLYAIVMQLSALISRLW